MNNIELPGISIVIPAFNAELYIGTSINSILNINYPTDKLELILVDDGSTDNTVARSKELLHASKYPWQIMQQDNHGPSSARNKGWQNAKYQWIQFLDGDDYLHPDKFQIQGKLAATTTDEVAIIYSPWARKFDTLKNHDLSEIVVPDLSGDILVALLKTEGFLQLGCQLFHRVWLEKAGGFNERLYMIEDVDLDLRLAMAGAKFLSAPCEQPLSIYFDRTDSLSKSSRKVFIEGCVRNARMVEGYWEKNSGTINNEQKSVLISIYANALSFYAIHDVSSFKQLYAHCRNLAPDFKPLNKLSRYIRPVFGPETAEIISARLIRVLR